MEGFLHLPVLVQFQCIEMPEDVNISNAWMAISQIIKALFQMLADLLM
jgi:hypothetical protein